MHGRSAKAERSPAGQVRQLMRAISPRKAQPQHNGDEQLSSGASRVSSVVRDSVLARGAGG